MARILVTLGSDGHADWVQTPDGQKFTLGPVSIVQFVAKLSDRPSRPVLDQFLQSGSAMISVDSDKMWGLLKPIRVRLAGGPFMQNSRVEARKTMRESVLQAIEASLTEAEKVLGQLTQASSSQDTRSLVANFVRAAGKIKSPNQSENQTYYGLGDQEPHEVTDAAPKVEEAPTAKAARLRLAYDVLQENSTVAGEILASLEETHDKVDALVKEGKRFNATQAKADLHEVSTKVAGILRDVDLTQSWVQEDLAKLASRANHLHGLFFPGQQGG